MEARELYVVAGSFIGFQLFFSGVSPLVSSTLTQGYGKLPPNKLNEWNSRGDPNLVKLNVAITCGYLLYDLLLLASNWSTMGDSFFVCHHLAALYAYGYVLTRGVLPYFANFRLISELSTPFVNQRWFFESLAYPRSHRLVVANGVAMAVAFFLVRIAVMPPYWAKVFETFGTPAFERLGLGAQVAWIVSCVCLDVLNVVWMYKIARGCYRVITGTSGKKKGGKASSDEFNHVNNHTD
ncbi:TLC domain-containing protein 4-B isoform X2 [Ictalurus punctatus]|uniref:TLC domain-containing protein 4-B isoform X2 n=1 Tax=Ictalurus punctatus TaxID=7998 RepID=A0A2D0Q0G8_ICTPU|nr:TLC domain-containing protein 4-B isoform X2 [Ictalurus punctatus]XP_053466803.1 TLC domain-containing protein 4-B isoform X2 [Ictalurus furcatus]